MNGNWTIDCADIHSLAAAWLDEQLSAAQRELFEAHLEQCSSCETFVSRLAEQSFAPPVIELNRAQDYWADMDSALVEELDRMESVREQGSENRARVNQLLLFTLAAALLLSFVWGGDSRVVLSSLSNA